jgi:hypothetical protein
MIFTESNWAAIAVAGVAGNISQTVMGLILAAWR